MLKPSGEIYQDAKFTSAHPFSFDSTPIFFGNAANKVPILDGSGLLPDSIVPNKGTAATYGDATHTVTVTFDAKGRATGATTSLITSTGIGAEPGLGNPGTSGYVLSSTTGGVRSWIPMTGGISAVTANNGITQSLSGGTLTLGLGNITPTTVATNLVTITPSPSSGILINERDATGADWALYATTGDFYLNNGSNRFKLSAAGVISLATWQGAAIADTYISSASTWNAKENPLTFSSPLARSTNIISLPAATSSVDGYLAHADWSTFNSKIGTITVTANNGITQSVSGGAITLGLGNITPTSVATNLVTITPSPSSGILINERDATGADWALYATTGVFRLNNGSDRFKVDAGGNITLGTWQGTAVADTYISSALTWNAKVGPTRTIATTAPITGGGDLSADRTITMAAATGSVNGYLTSTDWTAFNNKVGTTRTISTTSPITGGGDLSANRTFAIAQATTSVDGYLSATDWTTFNNKVATTRSISTTSPITGGGDLSANRTIAIPAATTSVNGYLTSTDWTTFNNKQAALPIGSANQTWGADGVINSFAITNGMTYAYSSITRTYSFGLGAITPASVNVSGASGNLITANHGIYASGTGSDTGFTWDTIRAYLDSTTGALVFSGSAGINVGSTANPGAGSLSVANNLTVGNAFTAADFTIGATSSYQPAVVVIGDSIAQLVANLTATKTVTTTNGSATVTTSGTFTDANVGSLITGTGIPANTYIGILNSSTSVGLSSDPLKNVPVNATASGSITASITPYGYNNYMGAAAGSGAENFTVPAIGTYNGLAVAPVVGQNVAVAGKTIEQLYEAMAPLSLRFRQEAGMNIAVVGPGPGTNNLGLLNDTPAMVYSKLEAFCRHLRQNGWRVIVVGLISRGNGAGSSPGGANTGQTWDQLVGSVNGYIRQNWAQFADRFVDWGIIGSGSNEFAAGGYSNTTWYSTDQLHPTYAGERKLASYVQPAINDLLTYYFFNYRNQLIVSSNNGTTHDNTFANQQMMIHNENPAAGQSSLAFTFNIAGVKTPKANIRADYQGVLNFGATGYIADYVSNNTTTFGPDVYGTNGSNGAALILYRDSTVVQSYRPFEVLSTTGPTASGTGVAMYYETSFNYGHLTSGTWSGGGLSAWKPWIIEGSSVKIAANGSDKLLVGFTGATVDIQENAATPTVLRLSNLATSGEGPRQEFWSGFGGGKIIAKMWSSANTSTGGDFHIQVLSSGSLIDAFFIGPSGGATFGGGTLDTGRGNVALGTQNSKGGALYLGNDALRYMSYVGGTPDYYNFAAGSNLIADGYTVRSDRADKSNIRNLASGRVRLHPVIFDRTGGSKNDVGFIADEVKLAFPQAVVPGAPDPKTKEKRDAINPMAILAKHEGDIQALQDRLDALESTRTSAMPTPRSPTPVATPGDH
jgi:hypothetical protein